MAMERHLKIKALLFLHRNLANLLHSQSAAFCLTAFKSAVRGEQEGCNSEMS